MNSKFMRFHAAKAIVAVLFGMLIKELMKIFSQIIKAITKQKTKVSSEQTNILSTIRNMRKQINTAIHDRIYRKEPDNLGVKWLTMDEHGIVVVREEEL